MGSKPVGQQPLDLFILLALGNKTLKSIYGYRRKGSPLHFGTNRTELSVKAQAEWGRFWDSVSVSVLRLILLENKSPHKLMV